MTTTTSSVSTAEAVTRALLLVDEHLIDDGFGWSEKDDQDIYSLMRRVRKLCGLDERSALRIVQRVHDKQDSLLDQIEWLRQAMADRRHGLLELRPDPLARQLARLVDPDALFILARGNEIEDDDPFNWAAVPARDGGPTRDLHRDGSTETHLHLGGALPPLFYWLPLMSGELDFTTAARAAMGMREKGKEEQWARELARAAGLRLSLAANLETQVRQRGFGRLFSSLPRAWYKQEIWQLSKWRDNDIPVSLNLSQQIMNLTTEHRMSEDCQYDWPFTDPLRRPRSNAAEPIHYAQGERRWLYHLGRWLRQQPEKIKQQHTEAKRKQEEATEAEEALRTYLRLRNAFHRLLIHDRGSDGLLRFVENFDRRSFLFNRSKGTPRKHGRARRRRRLRRKVVKLERSRMEAALTAQMTGSFDDTGPADQRPRRRIEMRVSLPELPLLLPTVQAWLDGIRDHLRSDSMARNSQVGLVFHLIKSHGGEAGTERALHDARRLEFLLRHYPDVRPFVIGIDAAGDERRAPPRVFAPAFAKLRGLHETLRIRPGERPLRLGFTYHVGEDVDDLLTGLRHIDEVATLLLPERAGGRLGHAMALGFDPERFYQRHGGETAPPLGTHMLDLVWAAGWLRREEGSAGLRYKVEDRLRELRPHLDQRRLERVFQSMNEQESEKRLLSVLGLPDDDDPDHPIPVRPSDLPWWIEMVTWLQQLTRRRLARKRLCIEANPTSNLIIGDFDGYAELPYRKLVDDKLPVSLNTDDPGLFLTSLPGEFSAIYTALTRDLTHAEALRWLEDRRFDAEQSSFLGNHVPSGQGALAELDHALARGGLLRGGVPR